jgi:fatty acid desaturase
MSPADDMASDKPTGGGSGKPLAVSTKNLRKHVPNSVLRQAKRRRDLPGLLFLGGHIAAMCGAGLLIYLSLGTLWVAPAFVLQGILIVCLFAPFHEASHHSAFRSDWLNNVTLWFSGLLLGNTPTRFTHAHVSHHAYTQMVEFDPQNLAYAEKPKGWFKYGSGFDILSIYVIQLCRFTSRRFLTERHLSYLPEGQVGRVILLARVLCLFYLGVGGISIYFGSWAAVLYWLGPRVACEWFQSIIRMSEHVGCDYEGEIEDRTRSVRTWLPIRWLCWNMPYHVEHHAFPYVPFHALPALQPHLMPAYRHEGRGYVRNAIAQLVGMFGRRARVRDRAV